MSENHTTDVVIIGAGPVGLFAIFECGMLSFKCHVVDALGEIGGQCTALYPEKPIYDIPACPNILAGDLIKNLEKQVKPFDPTYHLNDQVEGIEKGEEDQWHVTLASGKNISAKCIIIAAGVGAFGPNRPPLEGLEEYEGKSVFYLVRRREDFRDKNVVIAGGGDSAVDWAVSLSELAKKVYIVHRRAKFRGAPGMVDQMQKLADEGKIEIVTPYQLDSLKGDTGQLSHVVVKDLDGNIKELEADVLLPFFGLSMNLGPIAEWGLALDNSHISVDPATAQTSSPGIYAIGDIATYEGKLKLILTGFAEAAQAAHSIRSYVYPDQVFHFEYSTTQGVPDKKVG